MEDISYKRLMAFYDSHGCYGEQIDYVALAAQNEQDISEFAAYSKSGDTPNSTSKNK